MRTFATLTLLVLGVTSAFAQTVTGESVACQTIDSLLKLGSYLRDGDKDAFYSAMHARQESGECRILKRGDRVYVKGKIGPVAQVRLQGQEHVYWMSVEHLE